MNNNKKLTRSNDNFWIYGKHAVLHALKNPYRIKHKLLLTDKNLSDFSLYTKAILTQNVNNNELDKLLGTSTLHQGVALQVSPLEYPDLKDFINNLPNLNYLVALDQVNDPHNLGAILRNAAAFSVSGIILPKDNSPKENGIIAKTACGALDIVPIFYVTNLARELQILKDNHYWIFGLEAQADTDINNYQFPNKSCLVLGNEGTGLRKLTRSICDEMIKLRIDHKMESLNVSCTASICFHELYKRL